MTPLIIYIFLYIISTILCYGMFFAEFQNRFQRLAEEDYRKDAGLALLLSLICSIISPISILIIYLVCGFAEYGLKFK